MRIREAEIKPPPPLGLELVGEGFQLFIGENRPILAYIGAADIAAAAFTQPALHFHFQCRDHVLWRKTKTVERRRPRTDRRLVHVVWVESTDAPPNRVPSGPKN